MCEPHLVKKVEGTLDALFNKVKENPLKFFNEKDLHFVFHDILLDSFDSKKIKIIREAPCDKEVQRDGIGRNIDFGLNFPNQFNIGIEFGMGKVTDHHWWEWDNRWYLVRKNSEKRETPLITHMKKDARKLLNVKWVNHGFLVNYLFCISKLKGLTYFKKLINKRKEALDEVAPRSAPTKAFTSILYTIVIAKDGKSQFRKFELTKGTKDMNVMNNAAHLPT